MLGYPPYSYGSSKPNDQMNVYVIPDFVFKAFTSRYNLSDIHCYSKLRSVASLEDVAHTMTMSKVLNSIHDATLANDVSSLLPIRDGFDNRFNTDDSAFKMSVDEEQEFRSTITPMLTNKKFIEDTISRYEDKSKSTDSPVECVASSLEVKERDVKDVSAVPYKIVTNFHSLYISVEEGFVTYISSKQGFLEFISSVMRAAYDVVSFDAANRTRFYKAYLMALKA